jgi:hypothetical protein
MLVTKQEIKMKYRDYGRITIPKGTRITHRTALGIDPNYNFIDDLSWIPLHDDGKTKQFGLIHDATYYGINIPKELLEEK